MRGFEQAISNNKVSSNAISPPCEAKASTVGMLSSETLLEAGLHRTGMGRGEVFYFAPRHAEIPGGRPGKEVTLCLKWKTVGN